MVSHAGEKVAALHLAEMPKPLLSHRDVLVAVHTAGVNHVDPVVVAKGRSDS